LPGQASSPLAGEWFRLRGHEQAYWLVRFDTPTLVSLCGTRAVVGDSGNQRVVKLELAPAAESSDFWED
jgi:hypothetical protein